MRKFKTITLLIVLLSFSSNSCAESFWQKMRNLASNNKAYVLSAAAVTSVAVGIYAWWNKKIDEAKIEHEQREGTGEDIRIKEEPKRERETSTHKQKRQTEIQKGGSFDFLQFLRENEPSLSNILTNETIKTGINQKDFEAITKQIKGERFYQHLYDFLMKNLKKKILSKALEELFYYLTATEGYGSDFGSKLTKPFEESLKKNNPKEIETQYEVISKKIAPLNTNNPTKEQLNKLKQLTKQLKELSTKYPYNIIPSIQEETRYREKKYNL